MISKDDLRALIAAEAARQNVPVPLALAVGNAESGLNPDAVSPKGARGVMQLMPATAQAMGVDPNSLQGNIQGGVGYLKQQLDTFKDPKMAVAAFNAGPGAVQKYGGVPPYAETRKYVSKVMATQPATASDAIFGGGAPDAPAPQGGVASDAIFADNAAPAPAPTPPPPPPGPAPYQPFTMGLIKGILPAAEKMASFSPLSVIPGFKDADLAAIARMKGKVAQSAAAGVKPSAVGQFGGNLATTGWIPGGPAASGAATGYLTSDKPDLMGRVTDAGWGAAGGLAGKALFGLPGKIMQGASENVQKLANSGVPLTIGQATGGVIRDLENKATSVPVLGDMIKTAQRRGLEGVNRAAYNETLANVGEQLPASIDIGREAFSYTKARLSHLYDTTLDAIGHVAPDAQLSSDLASLPTQIAQIGDPKIRANVESIIRSEVLPRFKQGVMSGEDMKAAQEALGQHIRDLTAAGQTKWSRDGGAILANVKSSLEGLVSRAVPEAGDMLAKINKAYSFFKPLETASASTAAKDGIFPLNTLAQGVAKGRAKSTLAAGKAPLQDLSNAASATLPSTVPDSGTAGRYMLPAAAAALFGGHLPVVGPAAVPAGLFGGGAASLYTKPGQQLVTMLSRSRSAAAQGAGKLLQSLATLAAPAGAVTVSGARQ